MRIKTATALFIMVASATGAQAQLRGTYEGRPDFLNERGYSSRDFETDMNEIVHAKRLKTRAAELANQGRLTEACASIREAIQYRRNIVNRRIQRSAGMSRPSTFEDRTIEDLGKDEIRYCSPV